MEHVQVRFVIRWNLDVFVVTETRDIMLSILVVLMLSHTALERCYAALFFRILDPET